jgi:hypothetical protein
MPECLVLAFTLNFRDFLSVGTALLYDVCKIAEELYGSYVVSLLIIQLMNTIMYGALYRMYFKEVSFSRT